jgi:RNA polymerase sigma-70 factor (ECF subfamily)
MAALRLADQNPSVIRSSPVRYRIDTEPKVLRPVTLPRALDAEQRPAPDGLASLARAAASGRQEAVRTLIVSVTPAVLKAVRGVLGSAHPDVEDAAQDAVWRFVRALDRFRYECGVLHFACRVAVHTALNVKRSHRVRGEGRLQPLESEDHVDPGPSPAEELAAAGRREAIRELFATLPTDQAEALILHLVLGFSIEETAATCGAPPNTVRSRLRLAKQAMRLRAGASPALQEALEVTE